MLAQGGSEFGVLESPSSVNLTHVNAIPNRMTLLALAPALLCLLAVLICLAAIPHAHAAPVRVVVWDEQQPEQKQAYSNYLGNEIAAHLAKQPGFTVKSVNLSDPGQGLTDATLNACDVLVWWGHRRHKEVDDARVAAITQRLKAGQLSLIALHSAHWSKPFVAAMNERAIADARQSLGADVAKVRLVAVPAKPGAPKDGDPLTPYSKRVTQDGADTLEVHLPMCVFPKWKNHGLPSHVQTLLPDHPLAKGVPPAFDLPQTEMYAAPFHVPPPDISVFEEHWDAGESFRSGSVWQVGKGRVFYFRPGHETYPIFKQEAPLRILVNAVQWLGKK